MPNTYTKDKFEPIKFHSKVVTKATQLFYGEELPNLRRVHY